MKAATQAVSTEQLKQAAIVALNTNPASAAKRATKKDVAAGQVKVEAAKAYATAVLAEIPAAALPISVRGDKALNAALEAAKPARKPRAKVESTLAAVAEATKLVRKPAAAAAPKLPLPAVYKDAQNHTCIVIGEGTKYLQAIPMSSAGINVVRMSKDKLLHDFQPMADYPAAKAAKVYLSYPVGMAPRAKAVLEVLAKSEAGKPLAEGALVAVMSKYDEREAEEAKLAQVAVKFPAKPAKAVTETKGVKAGGTPPVAAAAPVARAAKPKGTPKFEMDKVITLLTEVNPKRPGSASATRFAAYKTGLTVAQFVAAGGTVADVKWDTAHGFISIK